ncbi:MAG: DUF2950 family protein [Nitrospirae bacterium]|nr:DUF2950 family protein [Nitrospirota bacterium]
MHNWRGGLLKTIFASALMTTAPVALAATAGQEYFASPEAGTEALVEAVKANDQPVLRTILGPHSRRLMSSGDKVADQQSREAFIKAYSEANKVVLDGDQQAVLVIGQDEWPMPIPLVKSPAGWRFDSPQGEKEILVRRIGRNELSAIQVCLAIVDAAQEYATLDVDGDGIPEYTPRFVSTPGKHDGLYWEAKADEPLSPLGPLLAAATNEGYTESATRPLAPYHGYFYRILTKQGKDAPGGARDYLINGQMIGGFAVIAYPARYGVSGIMSFLVNQDGMVYEQNLGKNTAAIAAKINTFNPDANWKQAAPSPTLVNTH